MLSVPVVSAVVLLPLPGVLGCIIIVPEREPSLWVDVLLRPLRPPIVVV